MTDGAASVAPDADAADDDVDVKWLLGDGSSSVDVTTRVRTDVRVADTQVVGVRKAESTDEDHGLVLTGLSPGVTRVSGIRMGEKGGKGGGRTPGSCDGEENGFPPTDVHLLTEWKNRISRGNQSLVREKKIIYPRY